MCQGLFCLTQLATHSVGLAEAVSATMTSKFTIVFASHAGHWYIHVHRTL